MEKSTSHEQSSTNITHDFMRVESFSQLPFIRPPPPPNPFFKDKSVRLFGIEFNSNDEICTHKEQQQQEQEQQEEVDATNVINDVAAAGDQMSISTSSSSTTTTNNRKFECHYCCRNFPTSQALGGHQNAHKRERQHAKRVHLQSAAVLHGALGGWPTSPTPPSSSSSSFAYHSRLYENHHGSYYAHQQPINGSPLGLWRIPSVQTSSTYHRDRPVVHSMPMFTDLSQPAVPAPSLIMGGPVGSPSLRYFYDSKPAAVQDRHVSLDLHL